MDGTSCTNDWKREVVAFMDPNFNLQLDAGEEELKVSSAIKSIDSLTYSHSAISYEPTGMLANPLGGTFKYCPASGAKNASSVIVTPHSGRVRYSDATVTCS